MNFLRRIAKAVLAIPIVLISALPLYASVDVTEEWKDKYIKRVEKIEAFLGDKEAAPLPAEAKTEEFPDVSETEEFLDISEIKSFYLDATLSGMLDEKTETGSVNKRTVSFYSKVLKDPHSTNLQKKKALEQSAWINIKLGNFNEAIKICQEALERFPKDTTFLSIMAEAYYFRAVAYQGERQYDLAIENLKKILTLENLPPKWYAFAKDYLAHLYLKEGKDDIALGYFQSIIQDHPGLESWQGSAHYDLAGYYIRKKDYPKAKEHLQTILTNHPLSGWTKAAQDKLRSLK